MNQFVPTSLYRIVFAVMLLLSSLSCQTNDENVALPKTIADQIREDNQFSLLRAAMLYAGVGDALKGANLTLFAPNDAAFQASGLGSPAAITALPKQQVKNLLLYHVLFSSIPSANLPSGLNSVETASGGTAFLNRTSNGSIFINNAQVTQADVQTANGTIHIINRVLMPASGSVLEIIQTNPNLTYLAAAIQRIGPSNPTLLATLTGTASAGSYAGPITVFAPSNTAFQADSRFNTLSAIQAANPQTLANALLYHVASGVSFSNQLQTGTVTTLYNSNRLTTTVRTDQITVKGNRNTTPAVIRTPDITATNGVIHIIDQVLLP